MADTIADKIQNKKVAIIAAYSKCSEKGATLPESQIIANLAECIDTIELPPVYTGEYNITSNKELQVAGMKMKSNLTVAVPVPDGYIIPSGTKNIVSNGTHNVKQYANAVVDVKHFASGNISLSAGKNPVAVTGITDQNGETFTPKGFCFALRPTGGSSINYAKGSNNYCLVACIHTGEEATRIIAWHQNSSNADAYYSVKANPSTGDYSMSSGKFSIQVDNAYYRPIAGNYLWAAWG